ncbi:hypothetical protein CHS0354_015897 [Potamilus streckersoni]|uniref:Uncharacterized protein n=1 Tax=Potamilus streckersoni TaxID=2493646 RepID=A0AAE0SDH0_9BIVA|nr:hypothetical protein CHS0354_015897 [Potamilus streckersoni]
MKFICIGISIIFQLGFLELTEANVLAVNEKKFRDKRYATPPTPVNRQYLDLSNSNSILCKDAPTTRRLPLSNTQLMQIFREKGGSFIPDYMATNIPDSREYFINMIALDYSQDNDSDFAVSQQANYRAKQTILEDLLKLQTWFAANTNAISPFTNLNMRRNNPMTSTSLIAKQSTFATEAAATTTIVDAQEEMAPSSLFSAEEAFSNSSLQNYLPNLDRHDMARMLREAGISSPPSALKDIFLPQQRVRRNADGSTSRIEYCSTKGSQTDDGFLHMCSTCAVTTTLPDDIFPRYINEAICERNDRTCLTIAGTPHGICKQKTFNLRMIRKRPGGCMLMVHSGQDVVIDDWELYSQEIRVCYNSHVKSDNINDMSDSSHVKSDNGQVKSDNHEILDSSHVMLGNSDVMKR